MATYSTDKITQPGAKVRVTEDQPQWRQFVAFRFLRARLASADRITCVNWATTIRSLLFVLVRMLRLLQRPPTISVNSDADGSAGDDTSVDWQIADFGGADRATVSGYTSVDHFDH